MRAVTIFDPLLESVRNRLAAARPEAALARAQTLLREGRDEAVPKLLAVAADLPVGAYELGLCYLLGRGVEADLTQAAYWLGKAARLQVVDAQVKLACLHLWGLSARPGLDLFAPGFAEAAPDYVAAGGWARLAAQAGSPEAMALLGFLLSEGPEDSRDVTEAQQWYARAAAAGEPHGLLKLGLTELAAATTSAAAQVAITKLTAAGLPQADYALGTIFDAGAALVPPDLPRALAHFRTAAEAGDTNAMARYGAALLDARYGPVKEVEGETWLHRAVLAGDTSAALRLGQLYMQPRDGLPPHYAEAARWLECAARAGDAEAANALGVFYSLGLGVPRDSTEAEAWFTRAAAAGNEVAARNLAACRAASGK